MNVKDEISSYVKWGYYTTYYTLKLGRVAHSIQRLATGWTFRGSNPGGGEIFRTSPDQPWVPPSLLYNGYRVSSGGKAAGAWFWSPTPF
jgi:hypothetical protein